MSGTEVSGQPAGAAATEQSIPLRLEVVLIGVTDADRAREFYEQLGWRLDANISRGDSFSVVQMTPPDSRASVTFGRGITTPAPGSANILLAVPDVQAAREQLQARGAPVSDIFHGAGSGFLPVGSPARAPGRDPEGGSYVSFAEFSDPDGNRWLMQEIKERLPGRLWDDEL
jgi:catechol 2,3-dioxygenase-like lactoylglutathione lyase family enzyme